MPDSATDATRSLVVRAFAAYERGDTQPLFDAVADDVQWTIRGTNPLSGEYHSKQEFLEATYARLAGVLKEPVKPHVRRLVVEDDLAVVEWRGRATSTADKPYDNDYCWIMRVADGQIVEVTAYFDGALVEELFRTTEG
jgi:ketosteroid isomerase-like protein